MFLRLMFVLLIALNIAVGAWLLLGQPYSRTGMATDPGVPELPHHIHCITDLASGSLD